MIETCSGRLKCGHYWLNNNKWGDRDATQCMYESSGVLGWRWDSSSGINYPSIVVGTNFCNWNSLWNKFPIQWKNIDSWNITVEWNYPKYPTGSWNLSFDIYFTDKCNPPNGYFDNNKRMNNMVWIQGGGGLFYQYGDTIIVDDKTYYLDDPINTTWPRHNFILKDGPIGAGSFTVDMKKLLSTQYGLNGNWIIDGIHFGNEYAHSTGQINVTKYDMEINGSKISLGPCDIPDITEPNNLSGYITITGILTLLYFLII